MPGPPPWQVGKPSTLRPSAQVPLAGRQGSPAGGLHPRKGHQQPPSCPLLPPLALPSLLGKSASRSCPGSSRTFAILTAMASTSSLAGPKRSQSSRSPSALWLLTRSVKTGGQVGESGLRSFLGPLQASGSFWPSGMLDGGREQEAKAFLSHLPSPQPSPPQEEPECVDKMTGRPRTRVPPTFACLHPPLAGWHQRPRQEACRQPQRLPEPREPLSASRFAADTHRGSSQADHRAQLIHPLPSWLSGAQEGFLAEQPSFAQAPLHSGISGPPAEPTTQV